MQLLKCRAAAADQFAKGAVLQLADNTKKAFTWPLVFPSISQRSA
jgi:hypothetical protein